MKKTDDGFTLMETLLSIALVLLLSSLMVVMVSGSITTLSKSFDAAKTAVTVTRTDRFIRSQTESLHIPYWADARASFDSFSAALFRSSIGSSLISVKPVLDSRRAYRGVAVAYTVGGHTMRTVALFPSVPVMDVLR